MLKKMSVLAMAVGVVAAMVLPASASATWKHHATDIQTNTTIGVTGNVRFQGSIGGVECQVTSRVLFESGTTTGKAETFVPHPTSDTTNCKGLGGLAPCQTHNVAPQAPNWTIHTVAGPAISVTTTDITSQLTGGVFCLVKAIKLTGGTVSFTPNQANTASSAQLSGQLQADIQTNSGAADQENVTVSGTLDIESPNAATYSI
jgi:hypothetical protein